MNCPKCGKEGDGYAISQCEPWRHVIVKHNYCANCGEKLREKCPECEKMEPLKRPVCETKVREIKEQAQIFSEQLVPKGKELNVVWIWVIFLVVSVGSMFLVIDYTENSKWLYGLFPIMLIYFCGPFVFKRIWEQREKARQKFFRLHPEYAEIIRKSGGEG